MSKKKDKKDFIAEVAEKAGEIPDWKRAGFNTFDYDCQHKKPKEEKMAEKSEKGRRIIVSRNDFFRALKLLVFKTDIDSFSSCRERCEFYCIKPDDAYEKAKNILKENGIKFIVEE